MKIRLVAILFFCNKKEWKLFEKIFIIKLKLFMEIRNIATLK